MDKFDKLIKEAVESYEAPYDAQAWANVSSQLGSKGGAMKWIAGSAAVATIIAGTAYFMQVEEPVNDQPVVADHTEVPVDVEANHPVIENETGITGQQETFENLSGEPEQAADATEEPVTTGGTTVRNDNPSQNGSTTTTGVTTNNQGQNNTTTTVDDARQTIEPEVQIVRYNTRFNTENGVVCPGVELSFIPEDVNQDALYVWDFGDGTYSNSKVGTHSYKKAGMYEVRLTLKDQRTNKSLGSSTIGVTVNPQPATQFSWQQSNDVIPTISFINLTDNAETWVWNIKGLKTSTQNQFEYTFRKQGSYEVELTAENEYGCRSTLVKTINIEEDYNLFAPNAFEPNGDGSDDNFIPKALLIMDSPFTMVIYDKGGSMVYQTNNASTPWDGTNMNDNSPAPAGAYVWTVQLKNANGETEYYTGQVFIIR